MKICMLMSTNFPPEEGIGFYVYNLSKKLIERGHEVTIITRGSFKNAFDSFDGIKIIRASFLPIYPFHVLFQGKSVTRLIESVENQFDLLHVHFPLTPVVKSSLPTVCTLHGSMIENYKNLEVKNIKSLFTKIMARTVTYPIFENLLLQSDAITTVSIPLTEELKEYYGREDVKLIVNGVDTNKFTPKTIDNNDHVNVLYVGRMSYAKGLFELLEAIKNLKGCKDLRFYLIGKGDMENKIKKYIKNETINNVRLLGNLKHEELIIYYQNASIFVFPSHYEGSPTVVLEAMSSGLPSILSDIPAHKALINNEKNGILFKKCSSKDLTDKIEYLARNINLRKKIGHNARKSIEMNFTWDKISLEFENLYESLIKKDK